MLIVLSTSPLTDSAMRPELVKHLGRLIVLRFQTMTLIAHDQVDRRLACGQFLSDTVSQARSRARTQPCAADIRQLHPVVCTNTYSLVSDNENMLRFVDALNISRDLTHGHTKPEICESLPSATTTLTLRSTLTSQRRALALKAHTIS